MLSGVIVGRMVRDYLAVWIAAMLLAGGFAVFFMMAIANIPRESGQMIAHIPWVRDIIGSLVGGDILESWTTTGIACFVHAHPFAWALSAGLLMTLASGGLSAEMDRGTADLLLTLPVSRSAIYASRSAATLLMGLGLSLSLIGGQAVGRAASGLTYVNMRDMARIVPHFAAALAFLTGFFFMVAAACHRRGTALGVMFVFVFYWFVLNFLAELWPPAKRVAWTSFLQFYRPLPIVRDGHLRWGDIGVLVGGGFAFWLAGLVIWNRRDVPAR